MKNYKHITRFGQRFLISKSGRIVDSICFKEILPISGVVKLNGKSYSVDELVATTFIGIRGTEEELIHIDGDENNNYVDNLTYRAKVFVRPKVKIRFSKLNPDYTLRNNWRLRKTINGVVYQAEKSTLDEVIAEFKFKLPVEYHDGIDWNIKEPALKSGK